jgi:ABC-type lipoprotein release transport system permease subunit
MGGGDLFTGTLDFLILQVPGDPVTYAAISSALVAVALAATLLPAREATRVDPLLALRSE